MRVDENLQKVFALDEKEERSSGCCVRDDGSGCSQMVESRCMSTMSTFLKWTKDNPGDLGTQLGQYVVRTQVRQFLQCWHYRVILQVCCCVVCVETQTPNVTKASKKDRHMTCEVLGHPCCHGIQGECMITTREHCDFLRDGSRREEFAEILRGPQFTEIVNVWCIVMCPATIPSLIKHRTMSTSQALTRSQKNPRPRNLLLIAALLKLALKVRKEVNKKRQETAKARESVTMDVSMSLVEGINALPASPDWTSVMDKLNTIAERQEVLIAAVQQLGIKQVALDTAFAEIRGSRDHVRTMYKEVRSTKSSSLSLFSPEVPKTPAHVSMPFDSGSETVLQIPAVGGGPGANGDAGSHGGDGGDGGPGANGDVGTNVGSGGSGVNGGAGNPDVNEGAGANGGPADIRDSTVCVWPRARQSGHGRKQETCSQKCIASRD
ncbi:hypothetical protein ScPMuIL_004962 [Solemya velum]